MSLPRTLVLSDDEERTLVDARQAGEPQVAPRVGEAPTGGDDTVVRAPRVSGLLLERWHFALPLLIASLAVGAVAPIAYREHRVGEALRRIVDAVERGRLSPVESGPANPAIQPPRAATAVPTVRSTPFGSLGREVLERRGADLLVASDYERALQHYRLMATRFPEERTFSDFVVVLEAKLRCRSAGHQVRQSCE